MIVATAGAPLGIQADRRVSGCWRGFGRALSYTPGSKCVEIRNQLFPSCSIGLMGLCACTLSRSFHPALAPRTDILLVLCMTFEPFPACCPLIDGSLTNCKPCLKIHRYHKCNNRRPALAVSTTVHVQAHAASTHLSGPGCCSKKLVVNTSDPQQ